MSITKYQLIKNKIYDFFEQPNNIWAKIVRIFLISLIIISGLEFFVEIFWYDFFMANRASFHYLEVIIVAAFTLELVLRFWSAPKKIKFIFNFYNIIDFLAILPFFIITFNFSFMRFSRFLRLLRLTRLLRLAKLLRYSEKMHLGIILQENIIKNLIILITLVFIYHPVKIFIESAPPDYYSDILFTASILSLAGMFGIFAHSYASVDPHNNFDRFFSHLTTAFLVLPIGMTFEILQVILGIELKHTSILTYAIWFVYVAIIFYDFYNVKRVAINIKNV